MPTKIKVAVRVRPLLPQEIKAGQTGSTVFANPEKKEIV